MKFAALVFALLLVGTLAHADTIMPNTHRIEKCVKVTGLDAYPGYTFIGAISPISSPSSPVEFVKIQNNECIVTSSHYKFDSFSVYYANNSYIEKIGMNGIKTGVIDEHGRKGVTDENLVAISGEAVSAPYMPYYVSDTDSAKSVTIKYGIRMQKGVFFMSKISEEKSNLLLNATGNEMPPAPPNDTIQPHTPTPQNPAPTPDNPFAAFWCWLMGLFGTKC